MATIDDLLAEHEIRQVLTRYCRGIDRGDLELVRSVYHPAAVDRHGHFIGSGDEFAEATTARKAHIEHSGNHYLVNTYIELDGEDARVESYFLAVHPHDRAEAGDDGYAVMGGRYLDHFQRRDGTWLILRRTVVADWSRTDLPGAIWRTGSWQHGGFVRGIRTTDDASYAFFAGADVTRG